MNKIAIIKRLVSLDMDVRNRSKKDLCPSSFNCHCKFSPYKFYPVNIYLYPLNNAVQLLIPLRGEGFP